LKTKLLGYLAPSILLLIVLTACNVGPPASPTPTPKTPLEPGEALILKMVPLDADQAITPDVQEQARRVMEARAREMGVANAVVRAEEPDLLIVELRGKDNTQDNGRELTRNGFLEIVDGGDQPLAEGAIVVTSEGAPTFEEGAPQDLKTYRTLITGREIVQDKVTYKTNELTGQPEVNFALNEEGARVLADFTASNIGKYMPILLDKTVISSPQIQGAIPSGEGLITGLNEAEARRLVAILRAGALPTRLELVETQQLGTATNP
jgi:preprotein translocase subunit SecD